MSTGSGGAPRVFHRESRTIRAPGLPTRGPPFPNRSPAVLDVVYVLGAIALFVIVGLIAKAVEKL